MFLSFPGIESGFYIVGGTSAGTPQMAAVVALANQARGRRGSSLGFLNDKLYGLAKNASTYASDFHDISVGNNQLVDTPVGFPAGPDSRHRDGLGYAERRESRRRPGCFLSQPRL